MIKKIVVLALLIFVLTGCNGARYTDNEIIKRKVGEDIYSFVINKANIYCSENNKSFKESLMVYTQQIVDQDNKNAYVHDFYLICDDKNSLEYDEFTIRHFINSNEFVLLKSD